MIYVQGDGHPEKFAGDVAPFRSSLCNTLAPPSLVVSSINFISVQNATHTRRVRGGSYNGASGEPCIVTCTVSFCIACWHPEQCALHCHITVTACTIGW